MKKKILIKCTSSCGTAMLSNAEAHTLMSFSNSLRNDYQIIISGIEKKSTLVNQLAKKGITINEPFIKYLNLKLIKPFIHIPVSLINLYVDVIKDKPDFLICLGGIFYNGLSILILGKLFNIKFLIRSAEDHFSTFKNEKRFFIWKIYSLIRYLISKFVIKYSDNFLTVGEYSLNMFRNKYRISEQNSFNICGPIDEEIINYEQFKLSKEVCKSNIIKKYSLIADKLILFVSNGSNNKGTKHMFKLAEEIYKNKIDVKIIWITSNSKIPKNYIFLSNIIKIIKPLPKDKLVEVLKGVDYLFFATKSRVGYGQIILETLICSTEVICFRPKGDLLNFVDKSYYNDLEEILDRLKNNIPPKKIMIPSFMDKNDIDQKLKMLIRRLVNEK